MSADGSFYAIVETNEYVKQVVKESRSLYLTGLNAMFLSRDASQHANGYATVTKELRSFSCLLIQDMGRLNSGIHELLLKTVRHNKENRMSRLTEQAFRLSERRLELEQAMLVSAQRLSGHREEVHRLSSYLTDRMREMQRMCHLGEQIALHAKVDATTVSAARNIALHQVAVEIANNVNQIRVILGRGIACMVAMDDAAEGVLSLHG